MAFALDASVAITWAMRDEQHPVADVAARRLEFDHAMVPVLWWYEVRNILLVNERRQRISLDDATKFLSEIGEFPIETDSFTDRSNLTDLARQYSLSVYDAAYLELAIRERLPLATLDKALRIAAEAAGVQLLA
jgi:predicted nucleic acid-binding protein